MSLSYHIPKGSTVVVAMSGGVDSSVVAALLKKDGFNVIGITLKTHASPETDPRREKGCCTLADVQDARLVAQALDIPYYVMNTIGPFDKKVIQPFIQDYLQGRTPNPCVVCNTEIKFDVLLQKAKDLGAVAVATGHYAQLSYDASKDKMRLFRAIDEDKDQSYVLFDLKQSQLKQMMLPLGSYPKSEVRKMAESFGLPVAEKRDSQEICFVGSQSYRQFVEKRVSPDQLKSGDICLTDGTVVGKHTGIHQFTIGQKKGLGLQRYPNYSVKKIDSSHHRVVIQPDEVNHQSVIKVSRTNWVQDQATRSFVVKIRYKHAGASAIVKAITKDEVELHFEEPQRAVTPGQAAVWYDGTEVMGGGWIETVQ
jgi:tRNA-uridine 2-sulfurtransferase